ncbi:MAG: hypothetical protein JRC89_00795 [Deltaproteobacteria bacterium]|nr:hypothetical protein [Deltaproteobacteria bacterium]
MKLAEPPWMASRKNLERVGINQQRISQITNNTDFGKIGVCFYARYRKLLEWLSLYPQVKAGIVRELL